MKAKTLLSLLPLLLLVGCGTTPTESTKPSDSTTKPSESVSESDTDITAGASGSSDSESTDSTETSATEEETNTATEEPQAKTYTMTYENIPATEQNRYNNDFDFQVDDLDFHGDLLQRGSGSYDGTIQMKKSDSYFYSKFSFHGTIRVEAFKKDPEQYNATLSLFAGEKENPQEKVESFQRLDSEDKTRYVYTADIDGYFSIKDESGYAAYVYSVVLEGNVQ